MSIDPRRPDLPPGGPMTVEEYLQLDRSTSDARYEYIDGIAYMMAGGTREHDQISRNIAKAIEEQLQSGPCTVFGPDMQVLLGIKKSGKKHYVYPDATVSCDVYDRRRGNILVESPRIVFEVLSPSTEPKDRGKKLKAYKACPDIQEIVFVSQFARHVEIYRSMNKDSTIWNYTIYDEDAGEIELMSINLTISMDDIYKNIDFSEPILP